MLINGYGCTSDAYHLINPPIRGIMHQFNHSTQNDVVDIWGQLESGKPLKRQISRCELDIILTPAQSISWYWLHRVRAVQYNTHMYFYISTVSRLRVDAVSWNISTWEDRRSFIVRRQTLRRWRPGRCFTTLDELFKIVSRGCKFVNGVSMLRDV